MLCRAGIKQAPPCCAVLCLAQPACTTATQLALSRTAHLTQQSLPAPLCLLCSTGRRGGRGRAAAVDYSELSGLGEFCLPLSVPIFQTIRTP